jgi:hypothetical protein
MPRSGESVLVCSWLQLQYSSIVLNARGFWQRAFGVSGLSLMGPISLNAAPSILRRRLDDIAMRRQHDGSRHREVVQR